MPNKVKKAQKTTATLLWFSSRTDSKWHHAKMATNRQLACGLPMPIIADRQTFEGSPPIAERCPRCNELFWEKRTRGPKIQRSQPQSTKASLEPKVPACPNRLGKVVLTVRRGKLVQSPHLCFECKKMSCIVWEYAQSNYGAVYLCADCKGVVMDRSFGKVDAMNNAFSGGAFEMNRRKH